MGVTKSVLQDTRTGLAAREPNMAAWTGIERSFKTGELSPSASDGITIRREDECCLLFIRDFYGHD